MRLIKNMRGNNELSIFLSVHYCTTSEYCIVSVMASQTEDPFSFVSVVRIPLFTNLLWTPLLGEHLAVRPERGNDHE